MAKSKKEQAMRIYVCEDEMTVAEAPVGLFLLVHTGTLICKSEYQTTDGHCDCIIVETGEHYCGDGDVAKGHPIVIQ